MTDNYIKNITAVRDKLDAENSEKILIAIGNFVDELEKNIDEYQNGYAYCLHATSISFEEISSNASTVELLAWETADKLLERLNYDLYDSMYGSLDNKKHFDTAFVLFFSLLLDQFRNYLFYSNLNIQLIEEYSDTLFRKQSLTTKTNKWGDPCNDAWFSILKEFSQNKLSGSQFSVLIDELPEFVLNYAKARELDNFCSRFVHSVLLSISSQKNVSSSRIVSGEDFEIHIKDLIESNIVSGKVELTPRTGDKGADLLLWTEHFSFAIQAKYYSSPVGSSAVQEIFSAKSIYKTDYAIVISRSGYTKSATETADALNVLLTSDENIVDVINYLLS